MSFFEELKRRNVVRMAVLYGVTSWLILQVADVLFDAFELPPTWVRLILAVLILGFPAAILFSWVYEMTPQGLKREKDVDRSQSVSSATGRKMNTLIIVLLVSAITVVAVDRLMPETTLIAEPAAIDDSNEIWPLDRTREITGQLAPERSVAVLPFVNMSGSQDNEYFSDGLTETLLHMLARVPDLKVAARTSSFAFKGQDRDIRDIAVALGVAHVLEGSVQRVNDRVRITAQLIRAEDGSRVWSERYDRTLKDIFGIQDEIATRVSGALASSLMDGGGKQITGVGTENVEAYDLYLRAISEQARLAYDSLQASEALLKAALAKDPEFLDAKTQLVSNYLKQADIGLRTYESIVPENIALLEQVLASRSDDVRARAWMLFFQQFESGLKGDQVDFQELFDELRALAAEAPSEVDPKILLLRMLALSKKKEETLELIRDLLALDPLNYEFHREAGFAYQNMEDWDNARAALERSLELEPSQPNVYIGLSWNSQSTGDAVGSIRNLLDAQEIDPQDFEIPGDIAEYLYGLGLLDEGDKFRARSVAISPTSPTARASELYRAIRFESEETRVALARQMIEDDVERRADAWNLAFFVLFSTAAKNGESKGALVYVEKHVPNFLKFEQPLSYKVNFARFLALAALYEIESHEELQQRLDHLAYFLDEVLVDGGGPTWRMETLAFRGETSAAIDTALTEIFPEPAIANPDIDLTLEQPFLSEVAADPQIQAALARWRKEKAKAAEEVREYLAGLDQI